MVIEILMTMALDSPSPITKVHKNIAYNLNPKKFRVYFVASKRVPNVSNHVTVIEIPSLRTSFKRALMSQIERLRLLQKCSILHITAEPYLIGFPYVRRNTILSLHGLPLDSYPHFMAGKILSNKVDLVHSVSKYTSRLAERFYGVESKVLYNGVDTEFFRPIQHYNKRKKVLYVGRLIKWKKPQYVAKLAKEFPQADFIIHGRAPWKGVSMESELKEIARELPNLKIQSEILTEQELRLLYQTSDIFLFPSTDWQPLVVLEAMACGVPLLLHAIGGQAEQVTQGKEGFLSYNYEQMKEHLHYLLEDESALQRMGKNARERSLKLDWKLVAKSYESMYEEML